MPTRPAVTVVTMTNALTRTLRTVTSEGTTGQATLRATHPSGAVGLGT